MAGVALKWVYIKSYRRQA